MNNSTIYMPRQIHVFPKARRSLAQRERSLASFPRSQAKCLSVAFWDLVKRPLQPTKHTQIGLMEPGQGIARKQTCPIWLQYEPGVFCQYSKFQVAIWQPLIPDITSHGDIYDKFNFRFCLPREIRQLFMAGLDLEATSKLGVVFQISPRWKIATKLLVHT